MSLQRGDKVKIMNKTLGIYNLDQTPFKKGEEVHIHQIDDLGQIIICKDGRLFEFAEKDVKLIRYEKI